jgi:hypothetical protein
MYQHADTFGFDLVAAVVRCPIASAEPMPTAAQVG